MIHIDIPMYIYACIYDGMSDMRLIGSIHRYPGFCMSQPEREPSPGAPSDSASAGIVDPLTETTEGLERLNLGARGSTDSITQVAPDNRRRLWILQNPRLSGEQAVAVLDRGFRRDPTLNVDVGPLPDLNTQDVRFYVVWVLPRAENPTRLAGLHWSVGSLGYGEILAENQNEFRGLRFCRVNSLTEGRRTYLARARAQGASSEFADRVFGWQ